MMDHFQIIDHKRPVFYMILGQADTLRRIGGDHPRAVEERMQHLGIAAGLLEELIAAYTADLQQLQDEFAQVAAGETPERWRR